MICFLFVVAVGASSTAQVKKYGTPDQFFKYQIAYRYNGYFNTPNYSDASVIFAKENLEKGKRVSSRSEDFYKGFREMTPITSWL